MQPDASVGAPTTQSRGIGFPWALLLIALLSACGDGGETIDVAETSAGTESARSGSQPIRLASDWYRPPADATFHWQLTGSLDSSAAVDIYDIDLFDTTLETIEDLQSDGRKVICYFSAGSSEDWRDDFGEFDQADIGEPLDGWEGERWLDIRSTRVISIMRSRLDLAATKGCDGVEPDNVQGYTNETGFDLTKEDQLSFNRELARSAHDRGLSIALKNAANLIPDLLDSFDFSVNEQCHEYAECAPYEAFVAAGKPVFNVEYLDKYREDSTALLELCRLAELEGLYTLVLPLDLDGSFRVPCDRS